MSGMKLSTRAVLVEVQNCDANFQQERAPDDLKSGVFFYSRY